MNYEYIDRMYLFGYLFLITILFIIYSEVMIGNILFRLNSENRLSMNLSSLFHFCFHPFHNHTLWNPSTLDINYLFILFCSLIFYFVAFYLRKNIYILQ